MSYSIRLSGDLPVAASIGHIKSVGFHLCTIFHVGWCSGRVEIR